MDLFSVLKSFSETPGVTGSEDKIREILIGHLKPNVDDIIVDKAGNVIAVRRGSAPKIMLAAHMDQIGLMINKIDKNGFLRFTPVGGFDQRTLLAQRVIVHTTTKDIFGVVGAKPPHIVSPEERKKIVEMKDLFIDVGAKDEEEVNNMGINIGDVVTFDRTLVKLGKDNVVSCAAVDNRSGLAMMVRVMDLLKQEDISSEVYAVGTIQEEVGLRGAGLAAYKIEPDLALALDTCVASDVPGVRDDESKLGVSKGPAIKFIDASVIAHPKIRQLLIDCAEKLKMPYQRDVDIRGGTDAGRIFLTKEGIPCGGVSVPSRYIHTSVEVADIDDIENSAKLIVEFIKKAKKLKKI